MLARLVTLENGAKHEHRVISLMPGGAHRETLESAGVYVADLGMRPGVPSVSAIVKLRDEIRAFRPDLIQTWLYHADLLATIALWISGRRPQTLLVWGIRNSEVSMRRHSLRTHIIVQLLSKISSVPDALFSNSEAGREAHIGIGYRASGWRVIANGVDVEKFQRFRERRALGRVELGIPSNAFVIGLCARVGPTKDHPNFIAAVNLFSAWYDNAYFVLIGSGTDTKDSPLARSIDECACAGRFRTLGERGDISQLLPVLDIATLSSVKEGFANVLAEAMACEVPCVTTDSGDARDIVGNTGVVVPVKNPEALASGWLQMAKLTHEERRRLGGQARGRIVERYSMPVIGNQIWEFYESLARSSSGA
jgi:glycosyltransferase involved in cell wall biosynthesis